MADPKLQPFSLERMARAVEKVRERLERAAGALESAGVPYAVVGGNAVAAWVARVDEAAVRNTQDVDVVIRRADLAAAIRAMEAAGFVYRHTSGMDMFQGGPEDRAREAVKAWLVDEPALVDDVDEVDGMRVLRPGPLVERLLRERSTEARMLLRDLVEVGLVDATWADRLPSVLANRLRDLLLDPDG